MAIVEEPARPVASGPPLRDTRGGRPPTVIIKPTRGWGALRLGELWEYRELLYFLVWRDVKVRYKQTAIGATWAIIQPLLTMVVFSVFLGKLARVPSDGLPYPVFSYAGLLPWQLFAFALTQSSNSLVENQNLVRKVYFLRLLVPMAAVAARVVDFAIALVVGTSACCPRQVNRWAG